MVEWAVPKAQTQLPMFSAPARWFTFTFRWIRTRAFAAVCRCVSTKNANEWMDGKNGPVLPNRANGRKKNRTTIICITFLTGHTTKNFRSTGSSFLDCVFVSGLFWLVFHVFFVFSCLFFSLSLKRQTIKQNGSERKMGERKTKPANWKIQNSFFHCWLRFNGKQKAHIHTHTHNRKEEGSGGLRGDRPYASRQLAW